MQPPDLGFRPTIPAALRRAANEFGDHDYLVSLDERWTFAQAEHASARLARRMLAHGVGKGTRVGLFFPNGGDFLISWLAASRIGAVVLPFSTLNTARFFSAMPFFWIGGMLSIAGALHEPVTVLCLPRLQAGPALELLERERATSIVGFPTFTQQLRAHPDYATRDLSSARRYLDGPADVSMTDVPDDRPFHRSMSETGGSFFSTDVRVVHPDTGDEVPTGVEGELLVRGPGAMLGLHKREAWEVFDADGWYHSGDRVLRVDGDPRIFFAGRYTELIKSAGVNVSPKEVEAVLDEFDDIAHSSVFGLPDPERGQIVAAVVVPVDPASWDEAAVVARMRTAVSSYKVPSRWIVITETDLPLLATGKIDRRTLRAMIDDA